MSAKRDALAQAFARLTKAGTDSPRLDARLLLASAMNVSREDLLGVIEPTADHLAQFEKLLARREAREPLAYITGHREFWSLDFEVGPGVLIPRPETETLIEEALREFPDRDAVLDVIDLGTGSGCLLIAFLSEFPNARGVGIDRSADALGWAQRNVARYGLGARCDLSQSDWAEGVDGKFDVILSNPPYLATGELAGVATEVAGHEPHGALAAGADGLEAYKTLAPLIVRLLKPGGRGFLEIGAGQADGVKSVLKQGRLETRRIAPDLAGHPRCLVVEIGP